MPIVCSSASKSCLLPFSIIPHTDHGVKLSVPSMKTLAGKATSMFCALLKRTVAPPSPPHTLDDCKHLALHLIRKKLQCNAGCNINCKALVKGTEHE